MALDLLLLHLEGEEENKYCLNASSYKSEMKIRTVSRYTALLEALPLVATVKATRENSLWGVLLVLLFASTIQTYASGFAISQERCIENIQREHCWGTF